MRLIPLWVDEDSEHPEDPIWWQFYSIATDEGECPVASELSKLGEDGSHSRHAEAMAVLIETLMKHEQGPKLYRGILSVCHEAVTGEQIYAFRKGSLRLYWFYGADQKVVICPNLSIKNVKRTPASLAKQLIARRNEYFECHSAGLLEIITPGRP